MAIETVSITDLYTLRDKLDKALAQVERRQLTLNPSIVAEVDTALKALSPDVINVVGTGDALNKVVATSGVKVTAPVTGTGTTGVTFTISNGAVTGIALS